MSVTDLLNYLLTYRATTRGPGGPKKWSVTHPYYLPSPPIIKHFNSLGDIDTMVLQRRLDQLQMCLFGCSLSGERSRASWECRLYQTLSGASQGDAGDHSKAGGAGCLHLEQPQDLTVTRGNLIPHPDFERETRSEHPKDIWNCGHWADLTSKAGTGFA